MTLVYKVLSKCEWASALAQGRFDGAPVDLADGFIHLSAADQLAETLRRHFAGRDDLVLVGFEAETLGPTLKWEPSRGGALFPHLYAPLPADAAIGVQDLRLTPGGGFDLGGIPT